MFAISSYLLKHNIICLHICKITKYDYFFLREIALLLLALYWLSFQTSQ